MTKRAFREPIFAALFQLVKTNVQLSYATISRNFRGWDQLAKSPALMPAIFQVDGISYEVDQSDWLMPRYKLRAKILAYAAVDVSKNPALAPSQLANAIIDDIELSIYEGGLTPGGIITGDRQTLGGLVENAYVEGTGFVDPGYSSDGLVAITVPVVMVVGFNFSNIQS
jgi:hypothetical protein